MGTIDENCAQCRDLQQDIEHVEQKITARGFAVPEFDPLSVDFVSPIPDETEEHHFLRRKLKFLRQLWRNAEHKNADPDELEKKNSEYLSGWKRALADYENLQKQNAQAREEDRRRNRVSLAHDLLPIVDNFDQALKFAPKDVDKNWFAGVEHIARQFAEALKGLGIEPIDAVDHVFDPNLHESGGSRWEKDKPEHVVLEEVIKGWKLGDLVIRPSKVIVNQQ